MTSHFARRGLLAGAIGLPLLPRAANAEAPLRFSQVLELSGPTARAGDAWRAGVEMAVQEINAAGGVLGRALQVSTFDSTNGRAAVGRALDGSSFALLGPVGAEGGRMAAPLARSSRLAHIIGSDSLDVAALGAFRAGPGLAVRMPRLATWLRDDLRARRVSLVWSNSETGRVGRDLIGRELRSRGVEIASDTATAPGLATYAAEIAAVGRAAPDAAFIGLAEADCVRFLPEARRQGLKVRLVGDASLAAPLVLAQARTAAEGVLCHMGFTAAAAEAASFSARYRESFKDEPDAAVAKGYTAVGMLAAAAARMGRIDRLGVAEALRGLSVAAGRPAMFMASSWEASGEMDRATFLVEVRDGRAVVVKTLTGRG
jgi:branched-chain amino acid transport system substrate-binding protein